MLLNKVKIIVFMPALLFLLSCGHDDVQQTSQAQLDTVVKRLSFAGTATTGGYVKIELSDIKLEAKLDGNPDYNNGILPGQPVLPLHSSMIQIDLIGLNYYEDTVTVNCAASSLNKMPLDLQGVSGSFYEDVKGTLYTYDPVNNVYLEQLNDETIDDIAVPVINNYHFEIECAGSDSAEYRVSFYDRTNPLSHGITTKLSVSQGTIDGIIRVHRIGDGYHPYMDILL